MAQAGRSASSTRRGPSTPPAPDSVGRPPRSAMRNSLSHRLSREEMRAEELARGALKGVDMQASEVSRDWAQREWRVVAKDEWTGAMDTMRSLARTSPRGNPQMGATASPRTRQDSGLGIRNRRFTER